MLYMASLPITPLTEEQYLQIERLAEGKSEFHDGQMFAMAGGSLNHSLIAARMSALLDPQMPQGCRTFNSDLRIKIAAAKVFTYPDCGVFCGEPEFAGDQGDMILNPLLIVEVLSPSTESYDRGKKFALYRTIPSFREYLVVRQDSRHVEYHSKQDDGSWLLREYVGVGATVTVARLNVTIPLANLYASALDMD
jgi:Uma2 family endonuclease